MKYKKALSVLLAAVLLLLSALPCFAAGQAYGDVDADGLHSAADARMALRFAVGLDTPTDAQKAAADANEDGAVTAADARLILRMAVGLESPFALLTYSVAHPYYNKTFTQIHPTRNYVELALDIVSEWCCYYTVHDVLTPVLERMGYNEDEIERYAPTRYPSEKRALALKNNRLGILKGLGNVVPWYVPSLLLDYYRDNPEVADTYVFYPYYDDVITLSAVDRTRNAVRYKPQVGDLIFISNKEKTYVDGQPTVDHTAQIIQVNPDGTFLCTEGAIIQVGEDGRSRVRERVYAYNKTKKTYVYDQNDIVNVLVAVRLKLS